MLLYVFALLLVYTDGRGIGNPDDNSSILGNALIQLATGCGNKLLIEESKKIASECNLVVPPYEERQIRCLMLYDINNRLCHEKPLITAEDYKNKISEHTNITSFCTNGQWTAQNIPEYPEYKTKLDIILKDPFECYKICSKEDVISKDMNFYCTYFKWGTEMLNQKSPVVNTDTAASASAADSLKPPTNPVTVTKEVEKISTNGADTKKPTPKESESKDIEVNQGLPVQDSSSVLNVQIPNVDVNSAAKEAVKILEEEKPVPKIEPVVPSKDDTGAPNNEKPPGKKDEEKENAKPNQDPSFDKVKQGNSDPDYESGQEEEEGKEGLNGDDGDDPAIGEIKPYPANNKPANKAQVAVSILHPEENEKSIFPNMQDGFSDADDDHFFPFFLTVVILVVLLYVLYHNKSKVTKVVLGLIVEGRQSGRARRGSRGHAYRRLDTLEQAMGSSSAAPPSKIIY